MSDLDSAIQEFSSAYADLFALIDTYPPQRREQPGACGVWSVREVLAHFSGWIVELNRRYDAYDARDRGNVPYDFDEFNAASVNERAGQSWDETVSELRGLVDSTISRAQAIPAETAAANRRYARWLEILAEDCREHTQGLRNFAEVA